ncbi:MAG: 4-hydroxy-tetrahydrodipicolinate synthase [Clostridia bacterium]|nr:4-hydroxy-tetrahydrodipicolinate synthase [Clostridia bacterium]
MHKKVFEGVATALYTPITDDKIDFNAFSDIIDEQIKAGINALVFLGTTGEAATISDEERKRIVDFAVEKVKKRVPVIIGCGSNCTKKAREYTEYAALKGADGVLCVTPYYNKCTQAGLIKHYEEIAKAEIPIIAYNVPSRTGFNALPETVKDLADIDYVCGIKEANPDENHIKNLFCLVKDKIAIYSGNDSQNLLYYSYGASGCISVASNVIPSKIVDIFLNFKTNYDWHNNFDDANLKEFYKALFIKVNPIPLKAMVEISGKKGFELRLPLTKAEASDYEYFKEVLRKLKP